MGSDGNSVFRCLFEVQASLKPRVLGLFSLDGNYECQEHGQSLLAAHQLGITSLAI